MARKDKTEEDAFMSADENQDIQNSTESQNQEVQRNEEGKAGPLNTLTNDQEAIEKAKREAETNKPKASSQSGAPQQEIPKGVFPKIQPESDPVGINVDGGVTTNEGGDPPGSDLEVEERQR